MPAYLVWLYRITRLLSTCRIVAAKAMSDINLPNVVSYSPIKRLVKARTVNAKENEKYIQCYGHAPERN